MKIFIIVIVALCVAMCASKPNARCKCARTDSEVNPNLISEWRTEAPTPYCDKVQVIVTLKDGREVCITPNGRFHRFLTTTVTSAERCNCVRTDPQVNPNLISGLRTEAPTPYCKKVEVIVTLKDGREVCIKPNGRFQRILVNAGIIASAAHCNCVRTDSLVNPKLISRWRTEAPTPYCNRVEVIVTLKDGREVCIDPNGEIFRLLVNLRKKMAKNAAKKKSVRAIAPSPSSIASVQTLQTTTTVTPAASTKE